jgi:hypothetical protein
MTYVAVNQAIAQVNKEDRNNYPQSKPVKKKEWKVQKAPVVFSPHLSYREQKQMQLARQKVGGVTFYVNSKKQTNANYKQPNSGSSSKSKAVAVQVFPDTTAPYKRYDLDTLGH